MGPVFRIAAALIALIATAALTAGCSGQMNRPQDIKALMDADRAFSEMSVEHGTAAAFDAYMADDGVIFRTGAHPFEGRSAVRELLAGDPASQMSWEPYYAEVASSGDLGYTLGQYQIVYTSAGGQERKSHGKYVSIWRKQDDGSWKWCFDTGSSSPPPTNR